MFKPCQQQEKEVGRRAVESRPFMYLDLLEISFPRKDVMGKGWMHGWMGKVFLIALLKTRVCYLCVPEELWRTGSLWSCRFRAQSVRETGAGGAQRTEPPAVSAQQVIQGLGSDPIPEGWI